MTNGCRVRIEPAGEVTERGRIALKHTLGLSDEESQTLLDQLPIEAALAGSAGPDPSVLGNKLTAAGLQATFTDSRVNHPPCPQHARLAKAEVCPSCEERTCIACRKLTPFGFCPACTTRKRRRRTFKNVRVALLLVVLGLVALSAYRDRRAITSWSRPVRVLVHPITVDRDAETVAYAQSVTAAVFAPVAIFLRGEAARYGVERDTLIDIQLGAPPPEIPPQPPESANPLEAIWYSLSLRWWTWRFERTLEPDAADVRVFVLYHQAKVGHSVSHSIGLERGRVGIVNAFAHPNLERHNNVVFAHELLHTAGASDKYDEGGNPTIPDGYADPSLGRSQLKAALMAGAFPPIEGKQRLAQSLEECQINAITAREIGWTE